ncbi:D-amino-acid transaminase [Chthonobacter rhizosphaerae]|uniref:D-amino-acid transaminase n=1 Tax=Chthonobacter rhizosphaerae TaxID=2735553 RepID=UPI0015EF7A89|nr:D-amino-acid transaminase [Chthonobacter rhizosphaerae]
MFRTAYVNGRYVRHADAAVHVEDRGYQLADGVYEVVELHEGDFIDLTGHLDRLDRSLSELAIAAPMSRLALVAVLREVARRNRIRSGFVYLQVTRGVAPRDHAFPKTPVRPALVVTARPADPAKGDAMAAAGVAAITRPDERWDRVDIKTIGLLPNALAKQAAREAGALEAILVDADGHVTEGASTNVWIVTADGALVTRPADRGILRGITRTTVLKVAAAEGLSVEERRFTVAEALAAREVFLTSAGNLVMPIVTLDGRPIANGAPGSVATRLRAAFRGVAEHVPLQGSNKSA